MFSVRKFILSFLVLLVAFFTFAPQKSLASTTVTFWVQNDTGDIENTAGDTCYKDGGITFNLIDNGAKRTLQEYKNPATGNCSFTFNKLQVDDFKLQLVKPDREISYVNLFDGKGARYLSPSEFSSKTFTVKGGAFAIARIGLKPNNAPTTEHYKLNAKVKIDLNNNGKHDDYPTDTCFKGLVEIRITDANGPRKVSWLSQTDCKGNSLIQNLPIKIDGQASYKVELVSLNQVPFDSNLSYTRVYNLPSGPVIPSSVSKIIDVSKGDREVAFGLKPPTKTFNFTGYPFIDKNGDGRRDSNEDCYAGEYTVKVPGISKTVVGKKECNVNYKISKVSSDNSVALMLNNISGYTPTKLSYELQSNPEPRVVNGSTVSLPGSADVNFGLERNDNNKTSCKNRPKVDIKPISHEGKKGDKRKYVVTIKNEDKKNDDNCKADTFTLKADAINDPNNKWKKFEFEGGNKLTIKPGKDKPKDLFVTSPDNAQKGVKDLLLTVNSEKHRTKKVGFTYKVVTSDDGGGGGGGGGNKCNPEKPELTITSDKNSVKPGGKITYTVKVKNVDRGPCAKRSLSLQRVLPNDKWTGAWDKNNQFEIAKGVEKTFKLEVKSPNNATVGTKKITINLKKNAGDVITKKEVDFVISNAEPTCEKKAPGFSVTPDSITAKPGEAVAYTIVTKNNDTGPCAKRSLSLKAKLPTSWRAVFAKESFDLEKGGQATLNVAITSPTNAPDGTNTIAIDLNNTSGQIVKTQNVNYIVSASQTGQVKLNLKIGTDGIGSTPRIPLGGNVNPTDPNRTLTIRLFKASDNVLAANTEQSLTYNPTSQKFEGSFDVSISSGVYNIYVSGPRFLTAQFTGSHTLTKGQGNTLPPLYLITGNINDNDQSFNKIDMEDRHILLSCSIYSQDEETCNRNSNYKTYSDLNDDGIVNELDFNLWIKEVVNQQGAILPDEGN